MISPVPTESWSRPLMRERWAPRFFAAEARLSSFDAASAGASAPVEASGFPGRSLNRSSSWVGSSFSLLLPKRRRTR